MSEPLDIEAIRARANAAAEGPWHTEYNDTWVSGPVVDGDWDWIIGDMPTDDGQWQEDYRGKKIKENCIFVAHARQDIPSLCDEVEILKNKLAIAEAALEEFAELNKLAIAETALAEIGMLDREENYQSSSSEDAAGYRDMKAKILFQQSRCAEYTVDNSGKVTFKWKDSK